MVNLSRSSNVSLFQPNISSTAYSVPVDDVCFVFGWTSVIFSTFTVTYVVLLLPVSVLVLLRGLQKWRQNPSYASSMSHCDCLTYHTVVMELVGVAGCTVCSCGVFMKNVVVTKMGKYPFFFKWYGEVLFHVLTCLERYMAVVHPVTYLGLRNERGVRIRNVTVAFVWLFPLVWLSIFYLDYMVYWELSFLMLALVVISFCSVSVLRVLLRSGPGEPGVDRKRGNQSKRRAFLTIVSTLGVLMLRVVLNVTLEVVFCSTGFNNCVLLTSVFWLQLLSSLVLPILFLYKERTNAFKKAKLNKGSG